jgi:hypothetical protein
VWFGTQSSWHDLRGGPEPAVGCGWRNRGTGFGVGLDDVRIYDASSGEPLQVAAKGRGTASSSDLSL